MNGKQINVCKDTIDVSMVSALDKGHTTLLKQRALADCVGLDDRVLRGKLWQKT